MKKLSIFLVTALLLLTVFALTACGGDKHKHSFGEWEEVNAPSFEADGLEQRVCSDADCGEVETRPIPKLEAAYTITLNIDGSPTQLVPVLEDGVYTLTAPEKVGYDFVGWFDEADAEFPSSGTLTESVSLTAKFELSETTTFEELKERIEAGADKVLIAADITLTDTIYVVDSVILYAEGEYNLTRADDFLGDLFILGINEAGESAITLGKTAELSLGTDGEGKLTVDGNKSGMVGEVDGTAFLLTNSATLNMYDDAAIVNCKKTANDLLNRVSYSINDPDKAGGAAVIITSGCVFNMNGGLIDGCEVGDTDDSESVSFRGGAVFNYGNFYMYGGTISNCSAARGGAIYSYRSTVIEAGNISYNHTTSYGGAVYVPDSQYCQVYLGKEGTDIVLTFEGNTSDKSGGAFFVSHQGAVTVLGGTRFEANEAANNGGAFNMKGELTVVYAEFVNNKALSDTSKGGAIYAVYTEKDNAVRIVNIQSGLFQGNSACRGGAISVGSEVSGVGSILKIGAVNFIENNAVLVSGVDYTGYGGAVHVDNGSRLDITGGTLFRNNVADDRGGAIYITKASTLNITADGISINFITNSAADTYAGAIYSSGSTTNLVSKNAGVISFNGNTAVGNGGAIYLTSESKLFATAEENSKILFMDNSTEDKGGAIYSSGSPATFTDLTETGEIFFGSNEAAKYGGAISVHSEGKITLLGVNFEGNTAVTGGGALSVYGGSAVIGQNESTKPTDFSLNSAKNGGAIYVYATAKAAAELQAYSIIADANTASGGGAAIYTSDENEDEADDYNVTVDIASLTLTNNNADGNGGALYLYHNATVSIDEISATGNSSGKYGGVAYVSGKADVTIDSINASGNEATQGGCIYLTTGGTTLTIYGGDISDNTATETDGGNAIWVNSASAVLQIKGADSGEYLVIGEGGFKGKGSIVDIPEVTE